MGRHLCSSKQKLRKGLWSPEEDEKLFNHITRFGVGCWSSIPKLTGLDPNTHKPLSETKETDGKKCIEEPSFKQSQSRRLRTIATSAELWQASTISDLSYHKDSRENFLKKPVFDPLSFTEFQTGTNSNILTDQYHQNFRLFDQTHLEINANFGFTSMPDLTTCDYSNVTETDISNNSTSRILNETKESSNNSSNMNNHMEFNMNNMVDDAIFSWETETKLESLFQFQLNEIKTEELELSSWKYDQQHPLTSLLEDLTGASFDIFEQI
ncbi:hypothetical protein HHK36_007444 [Tetracentron sinense]|uniref:Uncharacterized protein n=1 Tax=Tetracentron sinense TaxID=13715 RepID=A0A834ZMM7_TETSI|nr:hypothetical protein HHK36_007444 [Tetracentron sinense]